MERCDLIFTVTPGRSGTKLLATLLSDVLGVRAEHEPAPRANFEMRAALADPNAGLRWLAQAKLPAIAALGVERYVETSHLYCKGFIELFFALGLRPRFIILRRDASAVARSIYKMNTIPGRTKDGRLVLLDPSDAGTLPFPGWESAQDYDLCYWYALEIERRQAMYRARFLHDGVAFTDVSLEDVTGWGTFTRLCAFVAPELDPAPRRGRYEELVAVDQHPRNVALPGTVDRPMPDDVDERERFVRRSVRAEPDPARNGEALGGVTSNERTRVSLEASLDPHARELARLRYRVAKQDRALDVYDATIDQLHARLSQAEAELETASAADRRRRATADELAARLETAVCALQAARSDAAISERRFAGAIAALRSELHAARARQDELLAAARDADERAARAQDALREMEPVVVELSRRCNELQSAVEGLSAEVTVRDEALATMQRTVSWRLTAPLRNVKRTLFRPAGGAVPSAVVREPDP